MPRPSKDALAAKRDWKDHQEGRLIVDKNYALPVSNPVPKPEKVTVHEPAKKLDDAYYSSTPLPGNTMPIASAPIPARLPTSDYVAILPTTPIPFSDQARAEEEGSRKAFAEKATLKVPDPFLSHAQAEGAIPEEPEEVTRMQHLNGFVFSLDSAHTLRKDDCMELKFDKHSPNRIMLRIHVVDAAAAIAPNTPNDLCMRSLTQPHYFRSFGVFPVKLPQVDGLFFEPYEKRNAFTAAYTFHLDSQGRPELMKVTEPRIYRSVVVLKEAACFNDETFVKGSEWLQANVTNIIEALSIYRDIDNEGVCDDFKRRVADGCGVMFEVPKNSHGKAAPPSAKALLASHIVSLLLSPQRISARLSPAWFYFRPEVSTMKLLQYMYIRTKIQGRPRHPSERVVDVQSRSSAAASKATAVKSKEQVWVVASKPNLVGFEAGVIIKPAALSALRLFDKAAAYLLLTTELRDGLIVSAVKADAENVTMAGMEWARALSGDTPPSSRHTSVSLHAAYTTSFGGVPPVGSELMLLSKISDAKDSVLADDLSVYKFTSPGRDYLSLTMQRLLSVALATQKTKTKGTGKKDGAWNLAGKAMGLNATSRKGVLTALAGLVSAARANTAVLPGTAYYDAWAMRFLLQHTANRPSYVPATGVVVSVDEVSLERPTCTVRLEGLSFPEGYGPREDAHQFAVLPMPRSSSGEPCPPPVGIAVPVVLVAVVPAPGSHTLKDHCTAYWGMRWCCSPTDI